MQVELKKATLSDTERILLLQSKTVAEDKLSPSDYLPVSEEKLKELLTTGGGVCVAEVENSLCGFMYYQYSTELNISMSACVSEVLSGVEFLRVRNAIVDRQFRHNELSVKLLNFIIEEIDCLNRNIVLVVAPTSIRSLVILFSQGFYIIGYTESENVFRLVMCKNKGIIFDQLGAKVIPINRKAEEQIKEILQLGLIGSQINKINDRWHFIFSFFSRI